MDVARHLHCAVGPVEVVAGMLDATKHAGALPEAR